LPRLCYDGGWILPLPVLPPPWHPGEPLTTPKFFPYHYNAILFSCILISHFPLSGHTLFSQTPLTLVHPPISNPPLCPFFRAYWTPPSKLNPFFLLMTDLFFFPSPTHYASNSFAGFARLSSPPPVNCPPPPPKKASLLVVHTFFFWAHRCWVSFFFLNEALPVKAARFREARTRRTLFLFFSP